MGGKLALEVGDLIKINMHLGLKPYREDQKELTEVGYLLCQRGQEACGCLKALVYCPC